MTQNPDQKPHPDADLASEDQTSHDYKQGGLEPKDSRNVTGTAKTEDGRWTGAAVFPEEGPKVPKSKD
jgi:hypothetical protein